MKELFGVTKEILKGIATPLLQGAAAGICSVAAIMYFKDALKSLGY